MICFVKHKSHRLLVGNQRKVYSTEWELIVPEALHAIRSLLCTSTNATPHERMFIHPRRSASGVSVPSWLSAPGRAYMKRQVKSSKFDDDVEEVELLHVNPQYAHVRTQNGTETTVSPRHLAPTGSHYDANTNTNESTDLENPTEVNTDTPSYESEERQKGSISRASKHH